MANDNDDQPVLSHIDRLVKEEEHLYGKSELTEEDRRRLADLLSRSMGHRWGRTFAPRCQYCARHAIHDILNAATRLGLGEADDQTFTRKFISSFDLPWLHQMQPIQRWLS